MGNSLLNIKLVCRFYINTLLIERIIGVCGNYYCSLYQFLLLWKWNNYYYPHIHSSRCFKCGSIYFFVIYTEKISRIQSLSIEILKMIKMINDIYFERFQFYRLKIRRFSFFEIITYLLTESGRDCNCGNGEWSK